MISVQTETYEVYRQRLVRTPPDGWPDLLRVVMADSSLSDLEQFALMRDITGLMWGHRLTDRENA